MTDKELDKLFNECISEVRSKIGKEVNLKGWRIEINGRLSRALGRTDFESKKIEMQKRYVQYGTYDEIKDTILHEIAHVLAGWEHKHDGVWKEMACRLGAIPKAGKVVSGAVSKHSKPKSKNEGYKYVSVNGIRLKVLTKKLESIQMELDKSGTKFEVI